jgi:uncharacterized protein YhbP (UPF0306 family)
MKAKQLLKTYLNQRHMMQLATVGGGKPWSCTVYYVADDALNLYWASIPSRRHSREIADCPDASIAIAVRGEKGGKVIGIQAEGTAEMVENTGDIQPIAQKYAAAFGRDKQWSDDFSRLKTEHRLYKFTPKNYVLFDDEHFPDDSRQEIAL